MYRVLKLNPQLMPFAADLDHRMACYHRTRKRLLKGGRTLQDFANAHLHFGIHRYENGWVYREWAPAAEMLYLCGDFNGWQSTTHPMTRQADGTWELRLVGENALWPGCRVKTMVQANGELTEHIPLYARRVVQDPTTYIWCAEITDEQTPFPWTDANFVPQESLLIYEAHVGMATEDGHVGTYTEFAEQVLPRIRRGGYNTVQLMAIMEHPYYGSFGYQVSNFFAASSRFGTPNELKALINRAHEMGIRVLLDVVHSHAVKNTAEGLNRFDGSDTQFFHAGPRGDHPAWGTKCFDYGKGEVLHFLLSNLKFWLEEYHFDGFRFDGVTSMLYWNHGLEMSFDDECKYFSANTDQDAVTYLQLANQLVHAVRPHAVTIAEDMSGMPGMALPLRDGGLGFDYRLGMGLPDLWIRLLKTERDEAWNLPKLWGVHCLRRPGERVVAYCESHDQALVGDKTLMFRLADATMYTDMEKRTRNPIIDRAVALHKMIRLLTFGSGGDAYLNFMGNEFGHPEWIDFPREGNGWSSHYCRRQWHLVDDPLLKYEQLGNFDRAMVQLAAEDALFTQYMSELIFIDETRRLLIFCRGKLLFAFNFHATQSYTDVTIPVPKAGVYTVALCSDDFCFGGDGRVAHMDYASRRMWGKARVSLYLPARTAVVLRMP